MALRVALTSLLLLPGLALAGRLGGAAPPVLVVDQWAASDASGRVLSAGVQARLRQGAWTADGLRLDWAPALDHAVDAGMLALEPLSWRDPPLQVVAAWRGGDLAGQPPDNLQVRVSRLSALAAQATQAQAAGLAARLANAVAASGASDGWFNFHQSLPVAGQARQVAWSLHVSASGTWFAGTPAIDAPGSAVLRVQYTSRAAASGLPAGLAFQDAGWLRWSLADAGGHPLAGGGGRDTGGAFDGSTGAACLLGLNGASGCNPAQEGITGLMERLGAAQAELTLTSALAPVYASTARGQRYALARLAVQRSLLGGGAGCARPPWQYRNDWQAAFLLEATRTRYALPPGGQWQVLGQDRVRVPAPAVPWKSLSVAVAAADLPGLPGLVIDPDLGTLVPLDAYPAGVQDVVASPLACQSASVP